MHPHPLTPWDLETRAHRERFLRRRRARAAILALASGTALVISIAVTLHSESGSVRHVAAIFISCVFGALFGGSAADYSILGRRIRSEVA